MVVWRRRAPRLWLVVALLAACSGRGRSTPGAASGAAGGETLGDAGRFDDGGRRIAMISEVPPVGPSADRREVDVPLRSIYLLTQPAPTGSAPHAIVTARLPCGYTPTVALSRQSEGGVLVRLRARWVGEGEPPPSPQDCPTAADTVKLVSLSILRVGAWPVRDEADHPEGVPAPPAVTQEVVADGPSLAPAITRWTRPCAADPDCPGGRCVAVGSGRVCAAEADPWRAFRQPCPPGARPTLVAHRDRTWEACLGACVAGACPSPLVCLADRGVCVAPPTAASAPLPTAPAPAAAPGR